MSFSGEKQNEIVNASWHLDHYLESTRITLFQFAYIDDMFGALCPTQFNGITALFKCMQLFKCMRVVWFCLVSNMLCDMTFISTYQPIKLTILSGCSCPLVKTSLRIQKKPAVNLSLLLNQTSLVC
jgi:hypothetical protein